MKNKERLKNNQKPYRNTNKNNKSIIKSSTILATIGIVIGIALIVFVTWRISSEPGKGNQNWTFAIAAKDFELMDTDGGTHKLSTNVGKIVFLDFTTSWCGYCKQQAPDVKRLYNDFGNDVQFYAIDVNEDISTVTGYKSEDGSKYPFLLDKDGRVSQLYNVTGYPHYILLKQDGTIFFEQKGYSGNFYDQFSKAIITLNH